MAISVNNYDELYNQLLRSEKDLNDVLKDTNRSVQDKSASCALFFIDNLSEEECRYLFDDRDASVYIDEVFESKINFPEGYSFSKYIIEVKKDYQNFVNNSEKDSTLYNRKKVYRQLKRKEFLATLLGNNYRDFVLNNLMISKRINEHTYLLSFSDWKEELKDLINKKSQKPFSFILSDFLIKIKDECRKNAMYDSMRVEKVDSQKDEETQKGAN